MISHCSRPFFVFTAQLFGRLTCPLALTLVLTTAVDANPPVPVVFVHGLAGDATTWQAFGDVLQRARWTFGGCPLFDRILRLVSNVCNPSPRLFPGDFYRMQFSSNQQLTLDQQGEELEAVIGAVLAANPGQTQVILVAHSMGGLASRNYLQFRFNGDVVQAITVGTPHLGAELAVFCQQLSAACAALGIDPNSVAVAELTPNSAALLELNDLIRNPLPSVIAYGSIIGTGTRVIGSGGQDGDGIVSAVSQNLANVVGANALNHTQRSIHIPRCSILPQTHTCEPTDQGVWTTILRLLPSQPPSGSAVIFSSFGSGASFADFALTIGILDPPDSPPGIEQGSAFRPARDFLLEKIELVVGLSRGPNALDVYLMSDSGGAPGTIIESFHFSDAMSPLFSVNPPVMTATSVRRPTLRANSQYWLVSSMNASGAGGGWYACDGCVGPQVCRPLAKCPVAAQIRDWRLYTSVQGVFRITGRPVGR